MNLPFFVFLFPLVWLAWNGYVFWRASSVPALARRIPRPAFAIGFVAMSATWPVGGWLEENRLETAAGIVLWVSGNWLGALMYLCICLAIVDLATGFGCRMRKWSPRLRGMALAAGTVLAATAMVQGTRAPVVEDAEVRMPGLPRELDGTTVAVLSDLHLGPVIGTGWLRGRVEQVMDLRPDLVLLVGDVVEGDGPPDADRVFVPELARLKAPMGVYAVTGNHDEHRSRDENRAFYGDAGIRLIEAGWETVRPGLVVAGIADSYRRGFPRPEEGQRLRDALSGRPEGVATVLMSHRPEHPDVAARAGVGLMLSGHTHAGQVWPFGYFAALWHPYMEGAYEIGGMTLLVSRGAGTWGPRMRLWSPGEILRVTLRTGPAAVRADGMLPREPGQD